MKPCYYNDSDPFVCAWLRNLIAAGHLPEGDVDERRTEAVQPGDLRGFTQCHFFAGIGGWAYALRLAGWPADRPVWTGSCPCQPFSVAGARQSHRDDRHLWPAWFHLIRECRPVTIFGEQVSGAAGLGWLDAVALDLETLDYAVGACVLGAHSVGAPHLRQRLYFVAESEGWRDDGALRDHEREAVREVVGGGAAGELGDAALDRERAQHGESNSGRGREARRVEPIAVAARSVQPHESSGAWDAVAWLPCRDGKARPVEPGTFPLAHGIPGRVGRLRAYGNSIVPQTAAAFVSAYLDIRVPRADGTP